MKKGIIIIAAALLAGCLTEPKERVRRIECKITSTEGEEEYPPGYSKPDTLVVEGGVCRQVGK